MKWCFVIALVCVISSVSCKILRYDFSGPNPDGSYSWAFETKRGIINEQRGSLASGSLAVEGKYQYKTPDGQTIRLQYKADENGFQPQGDHLPTPPPTPPQILRALAYIATAPPSDN